MSNQHRGEVLIRDDGKEYTLCFDWNALAELETEYGEDYTNVFINSLSKFSGKMIRHATYVGLKSRHPEITIEEVGNFKVPGNVMVETLFKALGLSLWGTEDFFGELTKQIEADEADPTNRKATTSET